jgi:pyruvate/2-oxoacid:ferredoxin oxidoreductase alpha subunit
VNVQRGGPSTGMPTNIEQSDLNIAVNGGHGDSPRVVLAPANVEDCFYTAIEAVNIARNYNVPVFILSDQAIATRIEAFTEPNLEKVCQDISPDLTPVADYKPYDLDAPNSVTNALCRARASPAENIPSPPASNTMNWAIRPARRNCTWRCRPSAAKTSGPCRHVADAKDLRSA